MRKRFLIFLAILVMILLIGGCAARSDPQDGAQAGLSAQESPEASTGGENSAVWQGETITVTDCIGRVVTVPKSPDRVATIFATTTQIVSMLGDSGKIVALSSGNLRDSLFIELYPIVLGARVPSGTNDVNIEELYADPAPQVIFCESAVTMDEKLLAKMDKFGVPLVTIEYSSVDDLQYAVSMIGDIMGRENEAAVYNNYFNRVFEFVQERVRQIPENEQKEVYHAINELLRTDIINTLPGDWIPRIGIKPVGVEEMYGPNTDKKHFVTLEQLFVYDPPYIIINGEDVMDYIEQSDTLHALSAYKNKQIYLLPVGITRFAHTYSVETPLAMIWLAKTIYPELFEDVDIYKEFREFYKEVFKANLDDETIGQILSGRGLRQLKTNQQ